MFGIIPAGFSLFPILLFVPLGLMALAFWIWMLVDAAQNKGLDQNERVVWIIVIALLHVLGAIIYLVVGRQKRNLLRT